MHDLVRGSGGSSEAVEEGLDVGHYCHHWRRIQVGKCCGLWGLGVGGLMTFMVDGGWWMAEWESW